MCCRLQVGVTLNGTEILNVPKVVHFTAGGLCSLSNNSMPMPQAK
jgi:hypothetical protein